jgi:hypothetical protein
LRVAASGFVRITGSIDHVYEDWRSGRHRVLEYKLTPPSPIHGDLMQVSAYALLHDRQHSTRPDVALFYLLPEHRVFEKSWNEVWNERDKVYDYIASLAAWESYDEHSRRGIKPPGDTSACAICPWAATCEARLGPKSEGEFVHDWEESAPGHEEPETAVRAPEPLDIDDDESEEEPTPAPSAASSRRAAAGEKGIVFGTAPGGATVVVPVSVLNTHVAVVGAAGSGKTWTAKVIAEEAIRNGVPVVAIDPQGDLVQFLALRSESDIPEAERPLYREFRERVEARIYTPGTSHGRRLSLNPIRLPDRAALRERFPDPVRRDEEERAIVDAIASNLVRLAGIGGDTEAQTSLLFQLLLSSLDSGVAGLADVVDRLRDPELAGVSDPDALIKKSEREKLARRLNSHVLGPAATLFEGGEPLDMAAMIRPSTAGKIPLNVIYLNALTSDAQKHFFVATLASEIYRWMVTQLDARGGTNLLFYIDEARDYIPAGSSTPPAKQPLIRLFTQGRKYGVGCLLCTQSPRSVDYNVFGNCSTKLIGRLEAAQDVERVREWFTTGSAPEWLAGRKGAEKGSFIGRFAEGGPAEGTLLTSRTLFSIHEGAWSPDRVEREVREV